MKKLAIITVGKTHCGKSTFAKELESSLANSLVIDQDNHAEFINTYYRKLQPKYGPNILKFSLTKFIAYYAKTHTNFHIIASNANRSKKAREYLLEEVYPENEFIRIIVHFDILDDILWERVRNSNRSTEIFRSAATFEEVLERQQLESESINIIDPVAEEADYLFVIKDNKEVDSVIKKIVQIAANL